MRLSNLLFPLFVFVILLQPSCTKNETDNYAKEYSSYIPLIKNSGYTNVLTFPNDSVFFETLSFLADKDSAFIASWSSARNFRSMRQIVDEIVRDEEEIALKYEDMTEHELDSVRLLPIEHSPIVGDYPNLLLERQTEDGGHYFD